MRRLAVAMALLAVAVGGSGCNGKSPSADALPRAPGLHKTADWEGCEFEEGVGCSRLVVLEGPSGQGEGQMLAAEAATLRKNGWRRIERNNARKAFLWTKDNVDVFLSTQFNYRRSYGEDQLHNDLRAQDAYGRPIAKRILDNKKSHTPGLVAQLSKPDEE